MSDYLLQLSTNPSVRKAVRALHLPVPLPVALRRPEGAWTERVLEGQRVVVAGGGEADVARAVARCLARSGASVSVVGVAADLPPYETAADAWARPVSLVPPVSPPEGMQVKALVFDATHLRSPAALRSLFDFFHDWGRTLAPSGRIVLLGRPAEGTSAEAATGAALVGFTKSLAKELGRKGSTVNLLLLPRLADRGGAAGSVLDGPLRYLLSGYSAFVTAQVLHVGEGAPATALGPWEKALYGKVAVVTGAAHGIGADTAQFLAREGAHVVCVDRPGEEVALGKRARAVNGSAFAVDVGDMDAGRRLIAHLREQHGGVDILVHNAGVTRDRTLGRMSAESWDLVLRVNLSAVVNITEQLLLEGVVRRGGRIIAISSVTGLAGNAGQTNYAASKAGLIGWVRALAPRVAAEAVTVNAVAPGLIETQMTARMPFGIREAARRLSALAQGGMPEDVASAVTFFSLPTSAGMTGEVLRVCGGALVGA